MSINKELLKGSTVILILKLINKKPIGPGFYKTSQKVLQDKTGR